MSRWMVRQGKSTWYETSPTDAQGRATSLRATFAEARWGPVTVTPLADPEPVTERRHQQTAAAA